VLTAVTNGNRPDTRDAETLGLKNVHKIRKPFPRLNFDGRMPGTSPVGIAVEPSLPEVFEKVKGLFCMVIFRQMSFCRVVFPVALPARDMAQGHDENAQGPAEQQPA
jgi:hypothetical protein